VTSCSTFKEHLQWLELIFSWLSEAALKINANKSHFAVSEIEYLAYWNTRDGIQPVPKKDEAIQCIASLTTWKQVWSFIGLINYYWDMWPRRYPNPSSLTHLTSKDVPFQWTDIEQQAFNKMKATVCHKVLLSYPDFNKSLHIHTDASHYQLGTVISQENCPIAFYSHKLQPVQVWYTTTERELLSIVETLKEYWNILLGQQIVVHKDH
jgi:putative transposase